MARVFNKLGEVVSRKAQEAAKQIGEITEVLMVDLFKQGMTPLECKGLEQYLQGQIACAAILELLKDRIKRVERIARVKKREVVKKSKKSV